MAGERVPNASITGQSLIASGRVPKMTRILFLEEGIGDLLVPVGDASLGEVIRRHFESYAISGKDPDSIAPQLACQMRQHGSILVELDAKQTAWKLFNYRSSNFNAIFFTHSPRTKWFAAPISGRYYEYSA
jgi:hypothetical protein